MTIFKALGIRSAAFNLALVILSFGAISINAASPSASNLTAQFDASPDQVILQYDIQHGLLPNEDTPRLQVFGDGTVEVFYRFT